MNSYAILKNSLTLVEPSNQYFTNTPNIPQWMGQSVASCSMNSANFVQGDLVIGWFESGEAQSVGGCFSGPQHVASVQALMANLTSQSTSRDVLWFYGLFDGQYWTQQRAALKAYVQTTPVSSFPVPFAYLDVNVWFDNSPKLFDILSGYTPCSSMNQASMNDYCS